jgi:hypothetical protein
MSAALRKPSEASSSLEARSQQDEHSDERSVGELFTELAQETGTLIRQEVKLAATEMTQKATYAGRQAAFVAVGGLLGVVCMLALVAALVLGLGTFMALWLSALIVGVVVGVVAFLIANKGITALREMDLTPKQTIQSIQEDKSWVQQQIR